MFKWNKMSNHLNKLCIILPTEAKLEEAEKIGLLSRWKFYFSALCVWFNN